MSALHSAHDLIHISHPRAGMHVLYRNDKPAVLLLSKARATSSSK
jgi:hypothetical protein